MFSRRTLPVWIGVILLSGMFLMGQESGWPPLITLSHFVGVWDGVVVVEPPMVEPPVPVTLTLWAVGDTASGTLVGEGQLGTETHTITGGTVSQGLLSFDLPVGDLSEGHPDCVNWDVSCTASLDQTKRFMTLHGEGIMCGSGGGQEGRFTAILTKR